MERWLLILAIYDLIKALLDSGIDPNKEYTLKINSNVTEICTPLRDVIWQIKDIKLAKLLIDYGADVNYVSKSNTGEYWPILSIAVNTNNVPLAQLLLENGADVNCAFRSSDGENWSLLNMAIRANSLPMVQLLLKKGISPDRGRRKGALCFPPLSEAIIGNKNINIVSCLLEYGANPNYERDGNCGISDALLYSAAPVEILTLLLYAGADSKTNYRGSNVEYKGLSYCTCTTPVLDLAVMRGSKELIKLLIKAGASFEEYCKLEDPPKLKYTGRKASFQIKYRSYNNPEIETFIKQYGWKGPSFFNSGGYINFDTSIKFGLIGVKDGPF